MSGSLRQKDLRCKQLRQDTLSNVSLGDNEMFSWSRGGLKDGAGNGAEINVEGALVETKWLLPLTASQGHW